jgi:hypothetical protein
MRTLLLSALACFTVAAGADERPVAFRYRAPILAGGAGSHYRVLLPEAVYLGVERQDLGDLRVLNASGEPVPYAFLPRAPLGPAPVQARTAKLFPLYGEESKGLDGVKLDIARSAGGTVIRLAAEPKGAKAGRKLLGYLVDASELESPIEAVIFDWQAGAGFNGTARVDASDDLARWSLAVGAAPVLMLEHSGERLERKRVELSGRKAKFLRLCFARVPDDLLLKGVQLELRGERVEPAREWRRVGGAPAADKRGEYLFDTGGRFPVDRLRLVLPQQNTVARVALLARDREDAPWRPVGAASVFRLQRDGAAVTNPDVQVTPTADRKWLLRVDQRGGGLGAGEVALEVGWLPHEVVFAARGAAPFALAYGSKLAKPEALQVTTVVPGYREGKEVPAQQATIGEIASSVRPSLSLADPIGLLRALLDSGEGKKWALWIVLSAGVLAVAWMALRLLREVGGKAPPGSGS